jgi:hypothetical protein
LDAEAEAEEGEEGEAEEAEEEGTGVWLTVRSV